MSVRWDDNSVHFLLLQGLELRLIKPLLYARTVFGFTYGHSYALTATLGGVYHYHPHFKEENPEAQKGNLSRVTQLLRGRPGNFGSRVQALNHYALLPEKDCKAFSTLGAQ